jgi:hypothetical protein
MAQPLMGLSSGTEQGPREAGEGLEGSKARPWTTAGDGRLCTYPMALSAWARVCSSSWTPSRECWIAWGLSSTSMASVYGSNFTEKGRWIREA